MKKTVIGMLAGMMLVALPGFGSRQSARHRVRHAASVNGASPSDDSLREEKQFDKTPLAANGIQRLTESDYARVAEKLGVETAVIKAVVEIEAGKTHQGFHAPGKPIINFDISMFRKFAGKRGINLARYARTHAVVFSRPNAARYGSTQAAQHERLRVARSIDETVAIQGCFWGMFQIGGFNWRKCGCSSIQEFEKRMSESEASQLELFADFVVNSGMLPALQAKNWSAFASKYNGSSYARRGYHTRLAAAYARYKSRFDNKS